MAQPNARARESPVPRGDPCQAGRNRRVYFFQRRVSAGRGSRRLERTVVRGVASPATPAVGPLTNLSKYKPRWAARSPPRRSHSMFIRPSCVLLGSALIATPFTAFAQSDPTPRRLAAPEASFAGDFSAMSGARELPDGRVLLTDFREPAVYVIDLRRRTRTKLGRTGSGPGEYRQPGGIYSGPSDTLFVLDRGQPRVLLVNAAGAIVGMRSVELRGTSSSSDQDLDFKRVDAKARAYFAGESSLRSLVRGDGPQPTPLLRLEPASQRLDTITTLQPPETRIISAERNMIRSRTVVFSPQDGWGLAPDGRVAVVRARPYRVEWIHPDGRVTRGPEIGVQAVPVTDADREAFEEQRAARSPGVAQMGQRIATTAPSGGTLFAPTKPPFDHEQIIVSPDGRVFVMRYRPAGSKEVVYDVFDERGARTDRIELPERSRIIGFGPNAIYVAERNADDLPTLRKYRL